jgi:integrase
MTVDDDDDGPEVWRPEETARFLEHEFQDRLSALYELAAYAGLRRAELCSPCQGRVRWHGTAGRSGRSASPFGIGYRDHGLVLCRPDGLQLRPDRVTVEFEKHLAACGLPAVRLHGTRHGACSLMLAGGVPIEIVH